MPKHSFIAVITAASIVAPTFVGPAAGNPPATMSWTEHGRGVAQEPSSLQLQAGRSLVVQTHVLEPGFRAPWHHHPDSSWVVMIRGELTVWFNCTDRRVWKARGTYFNPPMEKAVNEGTEAVELVVIYANVPAEQRTGTIPFTPAVPPSGCVSDGTPKQQRGTQRCRTLGCAVARSNTRDDSSALEGEVEVR